MKKYIVVMLFSFLMASCGQETEKIHLGENLRDKFKGQMPFSLYGLIENSSR